MRTLKLKFHYRRWQSVIKDAKDGANPYNGMYEEVKAIKDWESYKDWNKSIYRYKNAIFIISWTKWAFTSNIYEDVYNII